MSTEDELRNCRQGKRILKKRVDELERELRDARGRLSAIGNTLVARDPNPQAARAAGALIEDGDEND